MASVLAPLRVGTLRMKKHFLRKGQVIEYEAEPGIIDRLNIATYARTVAEMTYRALADHAANGAYKTDASPGITPPSPPVTFILPGPIARPRGERSVEVDCPPSASGTENSAKPPLLPVPPGE